MSNPFAELFGRSPIKPMQEHMARSQQCVATLSEFLDASQSDDWDRAQKAQAEIVRLENEADDLKHNIRAHLPKSLFLPVPRSDLLELLSTQDMLANIAKDIAGLMLGRKMVLPKALSANMGEYLNESIKASEQALKAINELDELLEAGFRGREVELVGNLIQELNRIEHNNDEIQITLRAELFKIEKELPPVDVMFYYKIIDRIGEIADYSQKVGSKLSLLLAH